MMMNNNPHRSLAGLIALALAGGVLAQGDARATTLYSSSNLGSGNTVLEIDQANDGSLSVVGEYATGGLGTDGGLGNQGALAFDDEFLYVVNAGSDEVSSFRILADGGLSFVDRVSSGGVRPVSLTVDRDVLYVVNAGSDDIQGFRVSDLGELSPIEGSAQALSQAGAGVAQISFSQNGRSLVVTEKATNRVLSFPVDRDGVAGPAAVFESPGATPFGFTFTNGGRVLVSEAAGGQAGLSSVTAWKLDGSGALSVIDPVVPTLETAACWVAATPDGRFAYTTNTGSGNLSAYRIRGGRLTLVDADGSSASLAISAGEGSGPLDLAISPDGQFLHTLNGGNDSITSFRINRRGDLELVAELPGLPDRATGLIAR